MKKAEILSKIYEVRKSFEEYEQFNDFCNIVYQLQRERQVNLTKTGINRGYVAEFLSKKELEELLQIHLDAIEILKQQEQEEQQKQIKNKKEYLIHDDLSNKNRKRIDLFNGTSLSDIEELKDYDITIEESWFEGDTKKMYVVLEEKTYFEKVEIKKYKIFTIVEATLKNRDKINTITLYYNDYKKETKKIEIIYASGLRKTYDYLPTEHRCYEKELKKIINNN